MKIVEVLSFCNFRPGYPCNRDGVSSAAFGVTGSTGDAKERGPQVGARAAQDVGVRAQLGVVQAAAFEFGGGVGGQLVREGLLRRGRPRLPPRTRSPSFLVRTPLL